MELYHKPGNAKHLANINMFTRIMLHFTGLTLTQPNSIDAPWHVQGVIKTASGENIYLNFWPHAGRAQRDGERAVHGEEAIRLMIAEAIDESQSDDWGRLVE